MSVVEESFRLYFGRGDYWILYVIALMLLIWKRRELYAMNTLGWYSLCVIFVIMNPLLADVVGFFIRSSTEYVRLYYLLPVVFTIACAGTLIISSVKNKAIKWCVLCAFSVLIAVVGTSYYEKGQYISNENAYKIPQEQKMIADAILEDLEEGETAYILGTFWDENWAYIRQYTSRIVGVGYSLQPMYYKEQSYTGHGDANEYVKELQQQLPEINYMIVRMTPGIVEDYVDGGHVLLLQTEGYAVFRIAQ